MKKQLAFFRENKSTIVKKSVRRKVFDCETCGLHMGCNSPKMEPTGKGRKGILFLAEAPGRVEDERGEQLIGPAGQLLRGYLKGWGFLLNRDGWKENVLSCRPPHNRTPTPVEIACCRGNVFKTIGELRPRKIVLLGATALNCFLGHRMKKIGPLSRWLGQAIPDQETGAWVFPCYHPSYVLRDQRAVVERSFEDQLERAVFWDDPFPKYGDEASKVRIIMDCGEAKSYLRGILSEKPEWLFFDYETTGIKPQRPEHRIVCMSMATDGESAVAFLNFDDEEFHDLLRQVLQDEDIRKGAQNLKFEAIWTREKLGYEAGPWGWDTMTTTHVLDNRRGICGLKYQTYVNFGTVGYEDEVSKYLRCSKAEEEQWGTNGINKIDEIWKESPEKVLLYCGLDSMFEYRLFEKQRGKIVRRGLQVPNDFLRDGSVELIDAEMAGISIDESYYREKESYLAGEIEKVGKRIQDSSEVAKWGEKRDSEFNPNSDLQVNILLHKILGHDPIKETAKGNPSVDNSVLKAIGTPFTDDVLLYRTLDKTKSTYVVGLLREAVNEAIHFSFCLHTVRTYRSSCTSPNLQNQPKRNAIMQELVRTGFKPKPGHLLLEADYSGIEVRISACYHKDPVMMNYIKDPTTDMHRDEAMALFLLDKRDVTKNIRYFAKNRWVFPQFYGSYWAQCAPNLWECVETEKLDSGMSLRAWMRRKGIRNYGDFENHVREHEDWFWGEKFKIYDQWKENIWEYYQQNLFIDFLTGFRCTGDMNWKEVINYPIQGASFHCLLWSLIHVNRFMKRHKMGSRIVGQIHDSMVIDVVPEELEFLARNIKRIMCEEIKREWKWIIVPLDVEMETSDIDGNWFKMHAYDII